MLSPALVAGASAGVGGIQRYGKGVDESKFIPPEFDLSMQGFPFNIRGGG